MIDNEEKLIEYMLSKCSELLIEDISKHINEMSYTEVVIKNSVFNFNLKEQIILMDLIFYEESSYPQEEGQITYCNRCKCETNDMVEHIVKFYQLEDN